MKLRNKIATIASCAIIGLSSVSGFAAWSVSSSAHNHSNLPIHIPEWEFAPAISIVANVDSTSASRNRVCEHESWEYSNTNILDLFTVSKDGIALNTLDEIKEVCNISITSDSACVSYDETTGIISSLGAGNFNVCVSSIEDSTVSSCIDGSAVSSTQYTSTRTSTGSWSSWSDYTSSQHRRSRTVRTLCSNPNCEHTYSTETEYEVGSHSFSSWTTISSGSCGTWSSWSSWSYGSWSSWSDYSDATCTEPAQQRRTRRNTRSRTRICTDPTSSRNCSICSRTEISGGDSYTDYDFDYETDEEYQDSGSALGHNYGSPYATNYTSMGSRGHSFEYYQDCSRCGDHDYLYTNTAQHSRAERNYGSYTQIYCPYCGYIIS